MDIQFEIKAKLTREASQALLSFYLDWTMEEVLKNKPTSAYLKWAYDNLEDFFLNATISDRDLKELKNTKSLRSIPL
jgi:hypothetical protein